MPNESDFDKCGIYQIVVEGMLDKKWKSWFQDFTITRHESGKSVLVGTVLDQAALYGLIARISNVGLPLISIQCLVTDCERESGQCIEQAVQRGVKLQRRAIQTEIDYFRVRDFLHQILALNKQRELGWTPARLDFWRWHTNENITQRDLSQVIHLWETPNGDTTAVLTPDGDGHAFFHIHPNFHSPLLEAVMIDAAETYLPASNPDGTYNLQIWTHHANETRQILLEKRGYTKGTSARRFHRQRLSKPIPEAGVPAGYTIRTLKGDADLPARSRASRKAHHPDTPKPGYEGWEWYLKVQQAPLYHPDLDLVATAPDGAIVAFCTIWFDGVNRTGTVVSAGTIPEHRRRGLGKAIVTEGLRRLQQKGAVTAFAASDLPPGHALCASIGFDDFDLFHPWVKEW